MPEKGWERHEREVAEMLGLDRTITSGNKFFDQGDAVTRGRSHPFPLYVDCKYTEHSSISVRLLHLRQWSEQAAEQGKRFLLPIRFHVKAEGTDDDWAMISLHDLKELMDKAYPPPGPPPPPKGWEEWDARNH